MKIFYHFLLALIFSTTTFAQPTPTINFIKIENEIDINGKLNNPAWVMADPITLDFEIDPGDNIPAKEKTIVKALYDNDFLYFGFNCLDSNPSQIRANLSERDRIFQDDFVIIVLDTYGDYQKAYEFCLNPFGIQGDLLASGSSEDINFDLTWFGEASINDSGWTAEFKIPLKSLGFEEVETPNWKFNAFRTMPRESRIQVCWTPIDRGNPNFVIQSGDVSGLRNLKSSSSIELLPYVIGNYNGSLADSDDPNSKFSFDDPEGRIGGGIKYSPSPNFSLDAVINPDFSQIESDAEQISVNRTFALYFREKRPFFLIGRELLRTPMYYSRSINDPLAAGRVIGKNGSLSYMLLSAYDRSTVFVVPGEEGSNTVETNKKSLANVGKLRYDFGNESYLGGLVMSRNMDGGHNYLVGFDWNYKFWKYWNFEGEGFFTQTKELIDSTLIESDREFGSSGKTAKLDGEEYTGNGIHLVLEHSQKTYEFVFGSNHFSPTYQTYNGLFSSTGFHEQFMRHEYSFYPENSFIDRGEFEVDFSLRHNYDGDLKEITVRPSTSYNLKGQTVFYINYLLVNNEKFEGKDFEDVNRFFVYISSRPIKELEIELEGGYGKYIYRGDDPAVGRGHDVGASVTLKPTPKLNFSFSYNRAGLTNRKTEELYYDGNIYRTTAIYQFSNEAFLRTILQYNSFDKTFRIYPLFSYKIGAFTTFYAGSTSNYQNYESINEIRNTGQQYFIKMQYLIGL